MRAEDIIENIEDAEELAALGAQVKELREAQELSYEDVAGSTFVRPHILRAIEAGRFDDIGAPVYVRGLVKTYCEFLMAGDIWKKYDARLPMQEPPRSPHRITTPRPVFRRSSVMWVYALLIIAVLGAAFLLWNQYENRDDGGYIMRPATETPSPSLSPSQPPTPAPAPIEAPAQLPGSADLPQASAGVSAEPVSTDAASVDLSWLDGRLSPDRSGAVVAIPQSGDTMLIIEITKPCRMTVTQNGSIVTQRTLKAGDKRTYDVKVPTPVTISVGDAADITWQGRRYAAAGSPQGQIAMTFFPDGGVTVTQGISPHFGTAD